MSSTNPSQSSGLGDTDLARAQDFIEQSTWTFAKTMPQWPHFYTLRRDAWSRGLGDEFAWFVGLIYTAGYDRPWGKWVWPSLDISPHYYWTHWGPTQGEPVSVASAILINRAPLVEPKPKSPQLSLEVDR